MSELETRLKEKPRERQGLTSPRHCDRLRWNPIILASKVFRPRCETNGVIHRYFSGGEERKHPRKRNKILEGICARYGRKPPSR